METAEAIQQQHPKLEVQQYPKLGEVRYGDWEGQTISDLARRKMIEFLNALSTEGEDRAKIKLLKFKIRSERC